MEHRRLPPVTLAVVGCVAIAVGVHQGLVHVAPGYDGTVTSGWDGPLSHEEVLLVQVGVVGVVGAVAARRWKGLASVPVATGVVVLFYAFRAVYSLVRSPRPLYREFSMDTAGFGGEPVVFVLGAEPFLLAAGGLSLVGAGVAALRSRASVGEPDGGTPPSARV
jgi:hypothetical protein